MNKAETKENLPVQKKESVFTKIKNWLSRFFKKEKSEEDETLKIVNDNNTDTEESQKNSFIESIKIENKDKILDLKIKLKCGQIQISELTDEELDEMIKLYEIEIEEKQKKLEMYQAKNKKEE